MSSIAPSSDKPRVWLLTDGQAGNETQINGLAIQMEEAGADVCLKQVRANAWHVLGAALLGGSGRSVHRNYVDALTPPWPDLVIGTGRRSAPWVRHIKARSGGKTAAVLFGQKGANYMAGLDLGLVLSHWGFPPHPRRETIPLPPTGATPERLAAAGLQAANVLPKQDGPWLLLVVGGRCFDHDLEPAVAAAITCRAQIAVDRIKGRLAVVTSRRTGKAVEAAIAKAAPDAKHFPWSTQQTPYLALLAAADATIVTGDSESMIAEAVAANRPTYIAPVQPRWSVRMAIERTAGRLHGLGGPLAWCIGNLWAGGMLLPARDLGAMARHLEIAGHARIFNGDTIDLDWRPSPPPDAAIAQRLLKLT